MPAGKNIREAAAGETQARFGVEEGGEPYRLADPQPPDRRSTGLDAGVTQLLVKTARQREPLPAKMADGVYDYYSSRCHPTLYALAEMWGSEQQDGDVSPILRVTVEAHEKDARLVVLAFYNALSY